MTDREPRQIAHGPAESPTRRTSYLAAIREAVAEEMTRDPRVFIMGQDVRTSVFGSTKGLVAEFGPERVRDAPLSEAALCGAAVGAALTGLRPIADLTIASFVHVAMDQLVSQAAKSTYVFGGQCCVPVVFRAAMFYNAGAAAQHSDRPYPMLMNVPGLKIVAPSRPTAMKGLLKSAIRDDNPVICFEDSTVWGMREHLPTTEEVLIPLGEAAVLREGTDVTIVAIAGAVRLALAAAQLLADDGVSAEVIDPQTLVPLDIATIVASVRRTGRLVVADPANRTCSAASEIAALVGEQAFDELLAPIQRVTSPDIHVPFAPALEKLMYPTTASIAEAARTTMRRSRRGMRA